MRVSSTTGVIGGVLRAVRCAYHCQKSGNGYVLCELSTEYEDITVTRLPERRAGYDLVKRCQFCGNWNGVTFTKRHAA